MATEQELLDEGARVASVLDLLRSQALDKAELIQSIIGAGEARELARTLASGDESDTLEIEQRTTALVAQSIVVAAINEERRSEEFLARVKPAETFALGRVVGAAGKRPAGLKVVVTTAKNVEIASGVLDDSGGFQIPALSPAQAKTLGDEPELVFTVVDSAGKNVHQTTARTGGARKGLLVVNLDAGDALEASIVRPGLGGIPSLDPKGIDLLQRAGIGDSVGLAEAKTGEVSKVLGISARQAVSLVRQAKKLAKSEKELEAPK